MSVDKKRTTLIFILCQACKKISWGRRETQPLSPVLGFSQHPQQKCFDWWCFGKHQWVGRWGNRSWPKPLSTWITKVCFPSLLCWWGVYVLPSVVRADPRHYHRCSGGSWVLFLFSAEAGQFLLLFWQIFNSLTKDVSEGPKLLTDFSWISWLDSVLKNYGIMLTGLNRKSSLDSYLPCLLLV